MRGIFGALSTEPVLDTLVEGLHRLEYRDYDSGADTTLDGQGLTQDCAVGKVAGLAARMAGSTRGARYVVIEEAALRSGPATSLADLLCERVA